MPAIASSTGLMCAALSLLEASTSVIFYALGSPLVLGGFGSRPLIPPDHGTTSHRNASRRSATSSGLLSRGRLVMGRPADSGRTTGSMVNQWPTLLQSSSPWFPADAANAAWCAREFPSGPGSTTSEASWGLLLPSSTSTCSGACRTSLFHMCRIPFIGAGLTMDSTPTDRATLRCSMAPSLIHIGG